MIATDTPSFPPFAGLGSVARCTSLGLSVESNVTRLKRYHYVLKRLYMIFTARITAEPSYELKTAFSHHSYLCGEHVAALRARVGEMREPPLGLDEVPHAGLDYLLDELLSVPSTADLLAGLYSVALPAVDAAMAKHLDETNPLADAPTVRVLRLIRLELADMIAYGDAALACAGDADSAWLAALGAGLAAAGGLDGIGELSKLLPERIHSAKAYEYDPVPRRDERFHDLFNQGVNAEEFLHADGLPARAKAVMLLFKRMREIDVPEMMASIIVQTPGKPWDYYRAMSRQLWDEARHAMLGEAGFRALGVDWTLARLTHNWSLRLNTECSPLERHGVLYFIEQGLMPKTGKRYEWEVAQQSGLPLMATIQDYDWADEVLHAAIGREWYVPQFGGLRESLAFGDAAWSKILSNWKTVKDAGLTEHENWWPAVYRQACDSLGDTPDPAALAFDVTYEGKRADLKGVS